MAEEAPLRETEHGLAPEGDGWFVLNARAGRWYHAEGRSAVIDFEGDTPFPHLGINLSVLEPGESMGMYHWEADQEDFLVLAGEPLLIIEGEERRLAPWDFVHCPAGTSHIIVGAGAAPSLVLAVGARERSTGEGWGAYTVDPVGRRHGAAVETETDDAAVAYAGLTRRKPTRYRDGWLPDASP
jgi:uncharacterized cupin superfamily protein